MSKSQKRLYEAYREKKEQEIKKNKYKTDEDDKIVVELNKNTGIKILSLIFNVIEKIIKAIIVIAIFVFITIGFTMLINPNLNIQDIYNAIRNNFNL